MFGKTYEKVLFLLSEWLFSQKKNLIERIDILVKITVSNTNDQKDRIISPNLNFLSPQNARPNI